MPAAITKTGIQQLFKDDLEDRIEQAQERIEESGGDPNDVKLDNSYAGRLIAPELLPGGMSDFLIYLQEIYENKDNVGGEAVVNKIIQAYAKRYRANGKLKKSFVNGTAYLISTHGSKKSDSLPILIPLELSLTIDGIGGIFPGNSFHSEYLPSRYQLLALFQAFEVSHKIDSSGWTTSLNGKMRSTTSLILTPLTRSVKLAKMFQNMLKKNELQEANEQKKLQEMGDAFGIKERGAVKKGDTLIEIQHKATMERLLGQKPQGA